MGGDRRLLIQPTAIASPFGLSLSKPLRPSDRLKVNGS
jgi:hypothetical protein